jgi:gliding motility-associated-like protein
MKRTSIFVVLLFSTCFCVYSNIYTEIPKTESRLSFKENKGQIGDQFSKPRPDILFSGNSGGLNFYLRNNGISYQMYRVDSWEKVEDTKIPNYPSAKEVPGKRTIYRVDINWLNTNSNASVVKESALSGYENYYSAVCPNGATGIKSYKNITYKNLYNGIDLKWYDKGGDLKYDYVVAAGSDPKQIQFEIKGAETIYTDKNGELIIKTPLGILKEKAPYVTQNGKILPAKWNVNKAVVSFDISNIDPTKELIIDPLVRLWGTYYGGNSDDAVYYCDVDASGNLYASGYSASISNVATSGIHQTVIGDQSGDALLVKFDPSGARLWATYYGGERWDNAQQCSVDASGNYIAMVGSTASTLTGVIGTPGTHQPNYAGGIGPPASDAFLVKFDNNGIRQWGTYYGAYSNEWANGCAFDASGNIYITGTTASTVGLSTPGSNQPQYAGGERDGFIAKFNSSGVRSWGTYYGGKNWDWLTTCKTDASGNVFVMGYTESRENISTSGVHQPALAGVYGWGDAICAKFNSSGIKQWATYYGGWGADVSYNCVFDDKGNVYVAGTSTPMSQTLTTTGAHQIKFGGGSFDAFLLKLNATGGREWCTYYGGKKDEHNNWCSMDKSGNIYLFGCTSSTNNISTPCAYQENFGGMIFPVSNVALVSGGWPPVGGDTYIAKFNQDGIRLWGTYYGDKSYEGGGTWDVNASGCVDASGNIYLVGTTFSASATGALATPGSHQTSFAGGVTDGFIAKFDACFANTINLTDPANLKVCMGDSTMVTASPSCVTWYNAAAGGNAIGGSATYTTTDLITTTTFYVSDESCGPTTVRSAITVSVDPLPLISVNNPSVILCREPSVNLIAAGAVSYSWSPQTNISCEVCPDPIVSPTERTEYCVTGTDSNSCVGKVCSIIEVYGTKGHNFSMPNAFTPNNDGINDVFCLQGWDACNEDFHIMIFDRWGEKVYESGDPNFCWDGLFKGQLLSSDVYIYSVSAHYKDQTKVEKKGNITLLR